MTRRPEKQPTVRVVAHPMWRIRLTAEAPRYLLGVAALFGIVASARLALFPPRLSLQHEPSLPRCGLTWRLRATR